MKREKQLEWALDFIYDLTSCDNFSSLNAITVDERTTIYSLDKDLQEKVLESADNINSMIGSISS